MICTANSTMSRRAGDSIETVNQEGVQDLISAAERTAVRRFMFVSSSRRVGTTSALAIAKRAAEKRPESSRLDYTILLPSYFPETFLSPATGFDVANGKVRIYGDGTSKVSYIALDDFAKAVVACVDNPAVSRQAIPIGGLRLFETFIPVIRLAPQYVARELLHSEGFTDVQYIKDLRPVAQLLASGEVDISLSFIPTDLVQIDAGAPVVILAGVSSRNGTNDRGGLLKRLGSPSTGVHPSHALLVEASIGIRGRGRARPRPRSGRVRSGCAAR